MIVARYGIVRRVAGPRAFSQWVLVPILVILSVGTSLPELQNGVVNFYAWNSVAVVSLVVAWAFATGCGWIVSLVLRRASLTRFVVVIVAYFVTEAGRAVLVAIQADALALDDNPNWPYRIVAGGLTGLALFGLASFLVNEAGEYRVTIGRLMHAQRLLAETVSATATDLEIQRGQMLENVRDAVTVAIRRVLSVGGSSARDVADELVRVSDDVVRPLSHSLMSDGLEVTVLDETNPPRLRVHSVLNFATSVRPFRPEATILFALLLVGGAVLFLWPVTVFPAFVGLLVWAYTYLSVMRRWLTPRLATLTLSTRVLVIFAAYVIFSIVPGVFILYASGWLALQSWPYFFYVLLIGQMVLWPLAIISGVTAARKAVLADLRQSNQRLLWSRARLASQLWGQQKFIAVALHKDVQGTLLAAAMKLKSSRDTGTTDVDAIEEIRSTVLAAAEFMVAPEDAPQFDMGVSEIAMRWAGVLSLVVTAPRVVRTRLDSDPVCRRIVLDVLSEFVTNAVKHGQARKARAKLSLLASDLVRLECVNDGRTLVTSIQRGLGTRMCQSVSVHRGLENVGSGVRAWADIPIL